MTVVISVISETRRFLGIEERWNRFINDHAENPFFLSGFLRQFMQLNRSRGWTPLFFVISDNDAIVGLAPLMMRSLLGIRLARFLLESFFSPDFVICQGYEEICIAGILDFLFRRARCDVVDLILPASSPYLRIIRQKCGPMGIHFSCQEDMKHRILRVKKGWDEFARSRGAGFRYDIRRTERNLDRSGPWRLVYVDHPDEAPSAFEEIMRVERLSWKQARRARSRQELDQDLLMIWNGLQCASMSEPSLKWVVWLMEIRGETAAYLLVVQYKAVAYMTKTSYDQRHKKFSPGTYILNAAIRDLLDKKAVNKIDFLTDLPFMRTWTSLWLRRVRVMMSHKGILPRIAFLLLGSPHTRRIRQLVLGSSLLRWVAFGGLDGL